MVKVDQEADEAALGAYERYGGYVPRFFFLEPDGTVNTKLTSGHPRYPYFFHSSQIGVLKAAMKKATGG